MKPTVGRIVHYQPKTVVQQAWAAIIVGVNPGASTGELTVNLHVYANHEHGSHFMQDVPYAETPTRSHWSWPPRESSAQSVTEPVEPEAAGAGGQV